MTQIERSSSYFLPESVAEDLRQIGFQATDQASDKDHDQGEDEQDRPDEVNAENSGQHLKSYTICNFHFKNSKLTFQNKNNHRCQRQKN